MGCGPLLKKRGGIYWEKKRVLRLFSIKGKVHRIRHQRGIEKPEKQSP